MKERRIGGPRVGVGSSLLASRRPVYSILFPASMEKHSGHSGPVAGMHSLKSAFWSQLFPESLWFY